MDIIIKSIPVSWGTVSLVKFDGEYMVKINGRYTDWIMKNSNTIKTWKTKNGAEKAMDKYLGERK